MASKIGRGICSVKSTVKKLINVRTLRSELSALAIISWGIANSHCARGRHRAMW